MNGDKINGKTPDEIKKGLECCIVGECNSKQRTCPYRKDNDCTTATIEDALALIQQLERERDAAVKAMKYMAKDLEVGICCETCSHYAYDEEDESSICADCDVDSNWQWRGPEVE